MIKTAFLLLCSTATGLEYAPQMILKLFSNTSELLQHPNASVEVPSDYKILSGGATISRKSGPGLMLTASYPKGARTWVAKAKDHGVPSFGTVEAFAIAIHDPDDEWDVKQVSAKSELGEMISATATLPPGYLLTGGGAFDDFKDAGNLLYETYPLSPRSWKASGRRIGYQGRSAAELTTYAIGIRHKNLPMTSRCVISETSGDYPKSSPTEFHFNDRGTAVIGGGAKISQSADAHGNVLTTLQPLRSGLRAAGKDHLVVDKQIITTYLIACLQNPFE